MKPIKSARRLVKSVLSNEKLNNGLNNSFDWLFQREVLIQSGRTEHEVIYQGDLMAVRHYPLPKEQTIPLNDGTEQTVKQKRFAIPLLLVPPLGVTTEAFDLMPQRSFVRFMAAAGFHTYLIDWGKPQRRHAKLNMKDYADDMFSQAVAEVRAHSGSEEISLAGWCMGGLLALVHNGFSQDSKIKNIITIASPIDLHSSGLVAQSALLLNGPAKFIRKHSNWKLLDANPALLASPTWLTTLGFKLTDPVGAITTYWDLATQMWDRNYVENHSTTSDYLNNMLLYPGGVLQDMIVNAAIDNEFASGQIKLRGKTADLSTIKASLLVFAGERDNLVSAEAAKTILDVLPTEDKAFHIAPGGHTSVVLGNQAQEKVWGPIAQWLSTRSGKLGK